MLLRNVLLKSLRDQRKAAVWWSIGLAFYAVLIALFYPSVRDAGDAFETYFEQLPEGMLAFFGGDLADFSSPAGYLRSETFSFMVPIMLIVFAVGAGSGTIAGEESKGTLGLLLSNPVKRWSVVAQKFAAVALTALFLAAVFWVALVVGAEAVGMDMSLLRLAEATASVMLLGLAFGSLALAVGCVTGNRGLSIGVAAAAAFGTYLLNAFGTAVDWLESFRVLSPFYYYSAADPLVNGLDAVHALALVGMTVVLLGVALFAFERRDLTG